MSAFLTITRETAVHLCRSRMSWLSVWLCLAAAAGLASIDCTSDGWSVGFGLKRFASDFLREDTEWELTLYYGVLARILRWWVLGGLPVLAVFAAAAAMPESLAPGTAALIFPKAPGRGTVLLGRFAGGLVYMAILATVAVAALIPAIGWRLGIWNPALFAAVPYAVLLFSVLNAAVVAMGVLTRSPAAAVVVTLLFAGSVWALQESAGRSRAAPPPPGVADNGGHAVEWIAAWLPRTHDIGLSMERDTGVKPPRPLRELLQRWRIGRVNVGAAAAQVLDPPEPEMPGHSVNTLHAVCATLGFESLLLAGGFLVLRRRDL